MIAPAEHFPDRCYAVVRIADGEPLYCGPKLWDAARVLEPGTCHGQAGDGREALIWARLAARLIREARKQL
jgi:hypothetical protein